MLINGGSLNDLCRLGIRGKELVLIAKKKEEKVLASHPADMRSGIHRLVIDRRNGHLEVVLDGNRFEFPDAELRDLFGIYLGKDCICKTYELKLY